VVAFLAVEAFGGACPCDLCVLLLARLSVGEEDRAYLINQLVLVKKENAVLGAQASELDRELELLRGQKEAANSVKPRKAATRQGRSEEGDQGPKTLADEEKLFNAAKDKITAEIKRVKGLLAQEQPELRAVRHAYAAELAGRTELQRFLKQCLHDIRQVITMKENPSHALPKSVKARSGDLAVSGRSHMSVQLLRSQDRVVSMLYHKTFPFESGASPTPGSRHPSQLPNPLPEELLSAVQPTEKEREAVFEERED